MAGAIRELADYRGHILALISALAAYAMRRDWAIAIGAGAAVLLVKAVSSPLVIRTEKRRQLPRLPLPDLSQNQARVAFGVWRGMTDAEISESLGQSPAWVAERIRRIQAKWGTRARGGIKQRVTDEVGPPPHEKEAWEWVAEMGLGLGVVTIGITVLLAPADTPLIGSARAWIGVGLIALGLLYCGYSSITYFGQRIRS